MIGKVSRITTLVAFVFLASNVVEARDCVCKTDGGNWTTDATWNCDGVEDVPVSGDVISIPNGITVNVNTPIIYGAPGITLNVEGTVRFRNPLAGLTLNEASIINVASGALLDFSGFPDYLSQGFIINPYLFYPPTGDGTVPAGDISGPISFTKDGSTTYLLPVTLTSFTALANNSFINIKWSTASEWDFSHYEIEKSFDGLGFDFVAEVDPKGGEGLLTDYSYMDLFPGRDLVYYRLKMVDLDGSFEYSKVVAVSSQASLEGLSVFPNPAPAGRFSLYYPNAFGKEVRISVMNTLGQEVFNKTMVLDTDVLEVAPDFTPDTGHYMLNVQIDGQVFRKHLVFE